ncbi:hypothetical protein F5Y16DRAFT_210252 [Xylariaceae sp. FL0255]|nr:hypothetical protein F5Y16DRAFT_210252 [Xylariaceae sp. FL0255]
MDFLCSCFGRREIPGKSSKGHPLRYSDRLSRNTNATGADFQTLEDLRQRILNLTPEEAEVLLEVSDKLNASLTPREIIDLHKVLSSPPPSSSTVQTRSTKPPSDTERPPRTPTNHMLPATQEDSFLFCLPAEVRIQIWRYLVGGNTVYLAVDWTRKLVQHHDEPGRHIPGLLKVPLICRKAYLESINLLYSENTFAFGFSAIGANKQFFTDMDDFLLPQCTAVMRSLQIGFHLSGGYSQYFTREWDTSNHIPAPESLSSWNALFKALAQMKGLRELVVVVWASGDRRHEFRARELELMEIPSKMTKLEKFEVWLPWLQDESAQGQPLTTGGKKAYVVRREFEDRARFGVSLPRFSP